MGIDRLERLDSLLRRVIAEAVFPVMQGDSVPPGSITVTGVKCAKDLRDATVNVSVFGDEELKRAAIAHLSHHARRFQQTINREVKMKFTPRLAFKLDRSLEIGDATLALLDKLEAADRERPAMPAAGQGCPALPSPARRGRRALPMAGQGCPALPAGQERPALPAKESNGQPS